MRDLFVVRQGSTLLPLNGEEEAKLIEFPRGKVLRAKVTQPRSVPHNSFFHVVCQEAFPKWPKEHRFQPDDWKHLRSWLLCMADHCSRMVVTISDEEARLIAPIIKAFTSWFGEDKERHIWCDIRRNAIIAVRPLSIKFDDVDEHAFLPIAERVYGILMKEAGFDVAEHKRRWEEEMAAGGGAEPAEAE